MLGLLATVPEVRCLPSGRRFRVKARSALVKFEAPLGGELKSSFSPDYTRLAITTGDGGAMVPRR
jgi:hypothetical protein